jgi:hypothetical protein
VLEVGFVNQPNARAARDDAVIVLSIRLNKIGKRLERNMEMPSVEKKEEQPNGDMK